MLELRLELARELSPNLGFGNLLFRSFAGIQANTLAGVLVPLAVAQGVNWVSIVKGFVSVCMRWCVSKP